MAADLALRPHLFVILRSINPDYISPQHGSMSAPLAGCP
jgi:hypothetical protein